MTTFLLMAQFTVLSLAAGALSMWLYKLCSPQQRLSDVVAELKDVQRQLITYDGEFAGAQPLILASLKLSLLRLAMVIIPSVLAAIPILGVLTWGLSGFHDFVRIAALDWGWANSAEVLFVLIATLSAIAVKVVFRVQC